MKLTKTVVLKLAEHDEFLDKTLKAYTEWLNFTSKVVYENKKPILQIISSDFAIPF